jgi:hypothetical protein
LKSSEEKEKNSRYWEFDREHYRTHPEASHDASLRNIIRS